MHDLRQSDPSERALPRKSIFPNELDPGWNRQTGQSLQFFDPAHPRPPSALATILVWLKDETASRTSGSGGNVMVVKLIKVRVKPGHLDGYLAVQEVWNRESPSSIPALYCQTVLGRR